MAALIQRPEPLAPFWASTKYVYWFPSHPTPIVRVPTPDGRNESLSILPRCSEQQTFKECVAYRDQRGVALWGQARWEEITQATSRRSVAKHRKEASGPITGVHHMERSGGLNWVATWYERRDDGSRRKRSTWFSYGGTSSQFGTSEQAMQAAINRRVAEERRWYSISGRGDDRRPNPL